MIRDTLRLSCSAPISNIAVPVNTLFEDILNPFGDIRFSLVILHPAQLSLIPTSLPVYILKQSSLNTRQVIG